MTTPTPRTDALQKPGCLASVWDHARQLERELAQALLADLVCTLSVNDFRAIHSVLESELGRDMEDDDYQGLRKVFLRVESEIDRVDMLRIQRAKEQT
jgi:hypothetical protein